MNIIILGCGSSAGVPVIGCKCEICKSDNPKNKRTRSSILIQDDNTNVLIDTSPDLRMQALANDIEHVNAVFFTHPHADHINGLDDIRAFNQIDDKIIPIYGNEHSITILKNNFPYAFQEGNIYCPSLKANIIDNDDLIKINNIELKVFNQIHGKINSLGFIINNKIAYSTDLSILPDESIKHLSGIDKWIIDCVGHEYSYTHPNLSLIMEWAEIIKPNKIILTHLNHKINYENFLDNYQSEKFILAYDGMKIEI